LTHKNVRKNARIDEHILDLFFEGRLNPATKLPKDATPAEVHAWFKAQEHRTLATAARRRAHYDVEEAGAAEYHDAEVARLEAELAAGRGRKKRKNPLAPRGLDIEPTSLVDPEYILPPNPAWPPSVRALAEDMRQRGWVGRPIVAVFFKYDDMLTALTGSHRIAAARDAGIEVPIVEVDGSSLSNRFLEKLGDGALDDEERLSLLRASLGGKHPAVRLLQEEVRLNNEFRENPPAAYAHDAYAHDAYAHDADFDDADEVDDWVTIEECGCHACAPARMNPRAAKRTATGAYADLDSVTLVIENALANYGLSMNNILAVKFTRGGKSRGGACSYSRSLNKCQIMFNGLAWPAFTEEQRLNTVLHEAAHAIQFLTTGTSDHGPKWQKIARSIGCSGDSCMTLEASQAMVDAYAEAKGLEKRKIITREDAEAARADFAVGDYVSFDHKRERWFGKIVSRGPMHATVLIQSPREGITGKIPYPSLQKEAPPRFAEKVAGVDKPAPGESLSAWQARTGRGVRQ
jgi:predicted SprT family Zn-dependent metalloprotease